MWLLPVTQTVGRIREGEKMTPEQELANIETFLDEHGIPKMRGLFTYSTYGRVTLLAEKYAQQGVQPTGGILPDFLASLTPEQLSALKVLLTPPTSG